MPLIKLKFFLLLMFLLAGAQAWAQVATGSLGDPVISQDFGSVTNPVSVSTNYTFTYSTCPNDGSYTLGTSTSNCFSNAWHTVPHDHTGNPGGYMMIVNASYDRGEFFRQQTEVGALCDNTTYEFSAYIMNLIRADGQAIKPNISFIIETTGGVQIGPEYNTGDIPLSGPDGWVKYGTTFTTPPGVNQVVIRMVNNAPGGNGNDLLLDDIAFRAYGPIVKAGIAGDVSVTQTNLCVGSAQNYIIKAEQPAGYNSPKFQWQQNLNDGQGWTDISGEETPSLERDFPADKPVGSYQYRLGVAEGDNIHSLNCRVYSNAVVINITSYPDPPPLTPITVCEGEPFTLAATGGATYIWTGPNLAATSENPHVVTNASAAAQGRYTVEVISAAGCSTFRYVDVTVNLKPVIEVNNANPAVCRGEGVTISAAAADGKTYSWFPATGLSNPDIANPFASPDVSTLYTVTVTGNNDCVSTAQVNVTVNQLPVASAGADKKIFEGQSVTLDGSATGNILSYTWDPPDYLDDPHSPTPVATPPINTTYTLTVTSDNNCGIDTSSVFIRVYNKIVVPSAFTPNNDGVNDVWNIEALETYPQSTITIFTRSGRQVFQSVGYGKAWDGKLNGSLLPAGTYYYVIDLKNDTPRRSGWVALMR